LAGPGSARYQNKMIDNARRIVYHKDVLGRLCTDHNFIRRSDGRQVDARMPSSEPETVEVRQATSALKAAQSVGTYEWVSENHRISTRVAPRKHSLSSLGGMKGFLLLYRRKHQNVSGGIMMDVTMEKIVSLCKNRGFIFPGSEIYGGLANTWDYGPLGSEFKNNIRDAWWKKFVQENPYNVGLNAAILMNREAWVASGHVGGFSDPLMDCKKCKSRFRADKMIEDFAKENDLDIAVEGMDNAAMEAVIAQQNIPCPDCGEHDFTGIRKFNLMFKTYQGVTEDSQNEIYLRPETAQGIFVNFKNVLRTTRRKLPMGICQVGKSFRNEITPGNFTFRTREFEQMELEFFCKPGEDMKWFEYWRTFCHEWLLGLGMKAEALRLRDHSPEELSHYSNATTDFEFLFPFGWGELWGIADRTDFDLKQHMEHSGENFEYTDPATGKKFIPYCVEPSLGLDRVALAFLCDAYREEQLEKDTRIVLGLHPALAPFKAAVLPLQKKLGEHARNLQAELSKCFMVDYDETGSIGKRYRRQDEIGTPYCITVDFETLEEGTVTIRDRDTMEQIRIPVAELKPWLDEKLYY
jgi:glycyl-tRNA synthetase